MRLRWCYAHTEALRFLLLCVTAGGCAGALVALLHGREA